MVTKHLTKAKFGMEVFKFCLCLSIPGVAVLVFRVRLACWLRHAQGGQTNAVARACFPRLALPSAHSCALALHMSFPTRKP
jgi:hypothetical protein